MLTLRNITPCDICGKPAINKYSLKMCSKHWEEFRLFKRSKDKRFKNRGKYE